MAGTWGPNVLFCLPNTTVVYPIWFNNVTDRHSPHEGLCERRAFLMGSLSSTNAWTNFLGDS
jgi:hypothetical protein